MSEQGAAKPDPPTPPPEGEEGKKKTPAAGTNDAYSINDWNISIVDGDKVQMEKKQLDQLLGQLNQTVNQHTEFVKKTLGKEKERLLGEIKKSHPKIAKNMKDASVQDIELVYENLSLMSKPDTDGDKEEPDKPAVSDHNQGPDKRGKGPHSPLTLKDKEQEIYTCSCGSDHKLSEFF